MSVSDALTSKGAFIFRAFMKGVRFMFLSQNIGVPPTKVYDISNPKSPTGKDIRHGTNIRLLLVSTAVIARMFVRSCVLSLSDFDYATRPPVLAANKRDCAVRRFYDTFTRKRYGGGMRKVAEKTEDYNI